MSEYRVTDRRAIEGGLSPHTRGQKDPVYGTFQSTGTLIQVMVRADSPEEAAVEGARRLGVNVASVDVQSYDDPGTVIRLDPDLQRQLEERGATEITGLGL